MRLQAVVLKIIESVGGNLKSARMIQRLACVVLISFGAIFGGCHPLYDTMARWFFLPSEGVRQAQYDVHTERRVGFTSSDGISLVADIHRPKGVHKTPTILIRIPFSLTRGNRIRSDVVGRYWASRGYTVVIQGTRGRYESGGEFYPMLYERQDGIETLHWLEKQPWFNGRLGMWGGSSFGHTQWAVADQPTLRTGAFFIQIASTNFRAMFFPGNAFSLESAVFWTIRSRGERDRPVDNADLERGVNTLPVLDADLRAIGDTDFYNDWLLRQNDDDYWGVVDGIKRAQTIQAPVLLLAGWFDPFLPSQLDDYTTIKKHADPAVARETRLIIGPWAHAISRGMPGSTAENPYRVASIEPALSWFDHHLGVSRDSLDMPPVRLFVMGINQWRDENEWPLQRTRYKRFHMHSFGDAHHMFGSGRLDTIPPHTPEQPDMYTYDPLDPTPTAGGAMLGPRAGVKRQNEIEERSDVLIYTSDRLEKAIEITGPIKAVLYVSTDAPHTDFTAKLVDVYPDSSAYNLSDGILRRAYVDRNSPVQIEVDLWPTSHVFLPGHRMRVEISSSNFPRYDRNFNTGNLSPRATQTQKASQRVYHSKQYPSYVLLPVIP